MRYGCVPKPSILASNRSLYHDYRNRRIWILRRRVERGFAHIMKFYVYAPYSDGSGEIRFPLEVLENWTDEDIAQVMRILCTFAKESYSDFKPQLGVEIE